MGKIITSLIAILVVINLEMQQRTPKLVVCTTVGQLRGDYIEYFYNTLGEQNFERLMNEGLVYNSIRFEFSGIDQAGAFATSLTGSNPCFSGITGDKTSDFKKEKEVSILNDPEHLGNYTKENYSPKDLFSSTIGDELKIAFQGRSDVYSIAPDAESAILSAGRAANGAFWMDNTNGKWATTTYYKGIPWYVDRYNNDPESLASHLKTMVQTSIFPMEKYDASPYVLDDLPLRYTFSEKFANCYLNLKASLFIGKEINRLAPQFLEYGGSGTHNCPDTLSVTYYAGNCRGTISKEYTRETQDTYYQLGQDIEKLLDTIDKRVGLASTLVALAGSGYYKSEESYPDGLMVNGGKSRPKRHLTLLDVYLMAIYGQYASWVQGYYDNQIYSSRKMIEDAKLNLTALQSKATGFIQEFSSVQLVTTGRSLLTGDRSEGAAKFRQDTYHLRWGDLIVELQPGWKANLDNPREKVRIIRNNAVITPLVSMGNGLRPQHTYREAEATEVAPTVTHVLRIRPPNATQSLPLWELTTK